MFYSYSKKKSYLHFIKTDGYFIVIINPKYFYWITDNYITINFPSIIKLAPRVISHHITAANNGQAQKNPFTSINTLNRIDIIHVNDL